MEDIPKLQELGLILEAAIDFSNISLLVFAGSIVELSQLIPVSIMVSYAVLIWILRSLYGELVDRTKTLDVRQICQLQRWREEHNLVCDLTKRINNCFGSFLFLFVAYNFVLYANLAFELAMEIKNNNIGAVTHVGFLVIKHMTQLLVVLISTYLMQSQVKVYSIIFFK